MLVATKSMFGSDKIFYPKEGSLLKEVEKESSSEEEVIPYKIIIVYIILIVASGIIFYKLRKRNVISLFGKNKEGKLQVSEMRMLGNKQYLFVLNYKEKELLLGASPNKIEYLYDLSESAPIHSKDMNSEEIPHEYKNI